MIPPSHSPLAQNHNAPSIHLWLKRTVCFPTLSAHALYSQDLSLAPGSTGDDAVRLTGRRRMECGPHIPLHSSQHAGHAPLHLIYRDTPSP
jgi:hypothetical protein